MQTEIDRSSIYPGPRPFHDGEALFGRRREIRDLRALTIVRRVVELNGPSGIGKTSLLQAGLIPSLRGERVEPLFAHREYESEPKVWPDDSRSASIPLRDCLAGRRWYERPVVLVIFDQFEQFFLRDPSRWRERQPFFDDLADLMELHKGLHLLFAVRDEYAVQLDRYYEVLPARMERFRLEGLDSAAAMEAVVRPAQRAGMAIDESVAAQIVSQTAEGEFVDPSQLQIVCRALASRLSPDGTIDRVALRSFSQDVLVDFFEECVNRAANECGIPESKLRQWIETQFITPMGTRGMVAQEGDRVGQLPVVVARDMEGRWLLRSELRDSTIWYELAHDRLIEPIKESNRRWRAMHEIAGTAPMSSGAPRSIWSRLRAIVNPRRE